jgi:uncharacterized protein YehS (DUF1456 family)
MTNNDILKRIRYALDLGDFSVLEMTIKGGKEITSLELNAFYRKEEEEGYKNCSNSVLSSFLDGLIIKKRGPRENETHTPSKGTHIQTKKIAAPMNNEIMKKLKIALELKDTDIIEIFKIADFRISKSELSALFRRSDHKNFRVCGDQILRNFLMGLAIANRNI